MTTSHHNKPLTTATTKVILQLLDDDELFLNDDNKKNNTKKTDDSNAIAIMVKHTPEHKSIAASCPTMPTAGPILSHNKTQFLSKSSYPIQLSVTDLKHLVIHYEKKLGIKIIINGTTQRGLALLYRGYLMRAKDEVQWIQASLKESEAVGYLYTNGASTNEDHFEPLIITNTKVIKPIRWKSIHTEIMDESYISIPLPKDDAIDFYLHPQADFESCGPFSLLYLKELLNDDCRQLKEYCLQFPSYTEKKLTQNFFPSPQILRYSQSEKYNEYFAQMLGDKDRFWIEKNCRIFERTTLQKQLSDTMAKALLFNDTDTAKTCKKLLDELPAFRIKWLNEYKNAARKREQMNNSYGSNKYVTYRNHKMIKIVAAQTKSLIEEEKTNSKETKPGQENQRCTPCCIL